MLEKRKVSRRLILDTGKIVSPELATEIGTAVLDLSAEGACLLVPDITEVPNVFELVLDSDAKTRKCETRWKAGYRIGVRFR